MRSPNYNILNGARYTYLLTLNSSLRFGSCTLDNLSIAVVAACLSSKFKKVLGDASDGTCCTGTKSGARSRLPVATASSTTSPNFT